MEVVPNLCASKKNYAQISCKRSMMCPWQGIMGSEPQVIVGKIFYYPKMKKDVEHFVHTM
jgi:hypothetical protein